eukprot:361885-Chlamydomonas_euryale.AAC.9
MASGGVGEGAADLQAGEGAANLQAGEGAAICRLPSAAKIQAEESGPRRAVQTTVGASITRRLTKAVGFPEPRCRLPGPSPLPRWKK